ncbi:hypothetical protein Tco_0186042 [Tanacetum coccineum]
MMDDPVDDPVEKPNKPVKQGMGDHVHDEILGVMYDTDDDVSISGKEEVDEEVVERDTDQVEVVVDPVVD